MNKPLSVTIEEFKQNLANDVQKCELPIVIVDLILKNLYDEIHGLAKDFTLKEMQEYNNISI